jgi:hypothetical protein
MSRVMEAPFIEDAQGQRKRASRTTRHAVRSSLHQAAWDEDILDEAVLPVVPHDVGRKPSPRPRSAPKAGRRGGFKVWKTPFWKRRRSLWAARNAAERRLELSE